MDFSSARRSRWTRIRIPFSEETWRSKRNACWKNLKAILTHAGLTLSHVVKTTVFLKNMKDFAAMNEVYAKYFPVAAPARSTVQAAGLPKDALVEIELIAAL